MMLIILALLISSFSLINTFLARAVMVQNRNKIVAPLAIAEPTFMKYATLVTSPKANKEKKRCIMRNNGAPGWWTTCIFKAEAINSPQSQKLTDGSNVKI